MLSIRSAGLCVVAGLMVGCQDRNNRNSLPPLTAAEQASALTQQLQQNPNARVGTVLSALPERKLVAVGNLPVQEFRLGHTINFLNGEGRTVATGSVVNVVRDRLHVSY